MHPILFQIGPLRLSSYGLMIAIAFMVAIFFAVRETKRDGQNPEMVLDLAYYIIIAAIIGSRIFYIIINYDVYVAHPLDMFKIWQGGLVFYGGLIGSIIVSYWYFKKYNLGFLKNTDTLIVAVPLAHVFGRLGCLFAGCCYGKHAPDLPWAITFSNPASLAPKNIPLHPSQIYAAIGALVIFLILFAIKRLKKWDGQVISSYLILYPLQRIFEERFRGDIARKFLPLPGAPNLISTGDVVSMVLLTVGVCLFVYTRRRHFEKMA